MNQCTKCKVYKPRQDFHTNYGRARFACKACVKIRDAAFRKTLRGKAQTFLERCRYRAGGHTMCTSSVEEVMKVLEETCCYVCKTPGAHGGTKGLQIDHVPDGPVRHLLCRGCNYLATDLARLEKIIAYVREHEPMEHLLKRIA